MNVLLANPWPLDTLGGVTAVVRTLGAELERRGDHVVHLLPRHGGRLRIERGGGLTTYTAALRDWNLRELPWRSRLVFAACFLPSCWRLLRVLRAERIDVVNAHYFHGAWKYLVFLRRFCRFRLVVSLHGSDVLGAGGSANLAYLERSARFIDRLVFCSDGFRRDVLSTRSPLLGKATVVLNGLDVAPVNGRPAAAAGRDYIVCVAHLREHKGQDVLLRAFARLSRRFPALDLEILGEGPCRTALEGLASSLGIRDRVRLRGLVPMDQVREWIAGARAVCLPSRRETFGLVLVEAMALKVPVVATTVGGVPEIVRHEVDGLLVPAEDPDKLEEALRRVLEDAALRGRLVESGARRAREQFTAARFAERYREVFASLVTP